MLPSNFITWSVYSLVILLGFTTIKTINYQLNKMFDKNKIIVNEKLVRVPKLKLKSNKRRKRKKQPPTMTSPPPAITNPNIPRTCAFVANPNESRVNNGKTYDVINEDENRSRKTPSTGTNLEQLFADGGASLSTKSRRTTRNEYQLMSFCDSSMSSIATKTYKSNDNDEDNDENYSNIRFDDGIYERVEMEPGWQSGGKKKEPVPDVVEVVPAPPDEPIPTTLPLNQSKLLRDVY